MGFADCKEVAITISGAMPDSEIHYGLYVATTPRESWDSRWRKAPDPVFTHFWVVKDDQIIDGAADQFGGPEMVHTSINDPHYLKVGRYDLEKGPVIEVSDPQIVGFENTTPGGVVQVIWKSYNEYMEQFK